MAPRRWTSQEAQAFVNTFYDKYQICQATKDYSTFWPPFFEAWSEKFPERLVVFPDIPLNQDLDIEQNAAVKKAYERRKEVCLWYLPAVYSFDVSWASETRQLTSK